MGASDPGAGLAKGLGICNFDQYEICLLEQIQTLQEIQVTFKKMHNPHHLMK